MVWSRLTLCVKEGTVSKKFSDFKGLKVNRWKGKKGKCQVVKKGKNMSRLETQFGNLQQLWEFFFRVSLVCTVERRTQTKSLQQQARKLLKKSPRSDLSCNIWEHYNRDWDLKSRDNWRRLGEVESYMRLSIVGIRSVNNTQQGHSPRWTTTDITVSKL